MTRLQESLVMKLRGMVARICEIDRLLASPDVARDSARVRVLGKERGLLEKPVEAFARWEHVARERADAEELAQDAAAEPGLRELAQGELEELRPREEELAKRVQDTLILQEEDDRRDVIMEIRAGTGGEEAALFAGDLFRMYTLYAEDRGWKVEVLVAHKTDLGGFKEVVFSVKGDGAYRRLALESGTHRVQRVPVTEAQGRIHTSAATVAVLPEVEEVEVEIGEDDLEIETFCASGPGGQHVNKTASAVRITHLPTGLVVSCQDEKSQHRNKSRAIRVLRSRLYAQRQAEQREAIARQRRQQVGTGDRSEKIRTYNFPQNRITDHRAGFSAYNLQDVLHGKLDSVIGPVLEWDRQEKLSRL